MPLRPGMTFGQRATVAVGGSRANSNEQVELGGRDGDERDVAVLYVTSVLRSSADAGSAPRDRRADVRAWTRGRPRGSHGSGRADFPHPALRPQGPSGRFPCFSAPVKRSDSQPSIPSLASFPSLGGTAPRAETSGPPRFLGNACVHAALSDPGRTFELGHSGVALLIGSSVWPSAASTASAPATVPS
jgi:hypothetical protein